jgi:hypothetical protein
MPPRKGISMARRTRSRPLYLIFALALLASPAVATAGRHSAPPSASKATVVSPCWANSLWSALVALFGHSGGQMDPNGVNAAKPATSPTTNTVQPSATADSGAEMDPDG